jgi:protein-ribulosamine 3-kinase
MASTEDIGGFVVDDNVKVVDDNVRVVDDNVKVVDDNVRVVDDNVKVVDDNVKACTVESWKSALRPFSANLPLDLPPNSEILSVRPAGASAWVETVRIDVRLSDGTLKSYFKKAERGDLGRNLMLGCFESEKDVYVYLPNNVPKPIAFGSYSSDPDVHFFMAEFHDMTDDLPDVHQLSVLIAKLHRDSMGKSPNGKYGYHVATHLGNIANDNTWTDTWEEFFTVAMRRMLMLEEKSHGQDPELTELSKALFEKVIPRLMRPLETGGRSIQPCLVHSDIWLGNVKPDAETEEPIIFDSCAFWGHNEGS